MTEEQIREMVEEVERRVIVRRYYKFFEIVIGGTGARWVQVRRIGPRMTVDIVRTYDTPTDAIRAAIAMIDRLETAPTEDA